jgi:membrane protease subunit (stomatin/prohibitin family)
MVDTVQDFTTQITIQGIEDPLRDTTGAMGATEGMKAGHMKEEYMKEEDMHQEFMKEKGEVLNLSSIILAGETWSEFIPVE